MGPSHAEALLWDEGNESELGVHRISTVDVEEVFWSNPIWFRNRRNRSGDWKMLGRTGGGRVLTIVCAWEEDRRALRPITGWDATDAERKKYLP